MSGVMGSVQGVVGLVSARCAWRVWGVGGSEFNSFLTVNGNSVKRRIIF